MRAAPRCPHSRPALVRARLVFSPVALRRLHWARGTTGVRSVGGLFRGTRLDVALLLVPNCVAREKQSGKSSGDSFIDTDGTRTEGCLYRMPGLQHALVAFGHALSARARSKLARCRCVIGGGKLALDAKQLEDLPVVLTFPPSLLTGVACSKLNCCGVSSIAGNVTPADVLRLSFSLFECFIVSFAALSRVRQFCGSCRMGGSRTDYERSPVDLFLLPVKI